jgi:hypothetical protein
MIVRTLIEKWRVRIDGIPCNYLYSHFHSPPGAVGNEASLSCGLTLLGLVAASGLPPYVAGKEY